MQTEKDLLIETFLYCAIIVLGGVITHELGQRFNSPTVNLFMSTEDYLKFLTRLDHYTSVPVEKLQSDKDYPVGVVDDITIYFMHYPTFEEAAERWHTRIGRMQMDNLFVMLVEQAGCTEEIINKFCALPYNHKVVLTARPMLEYDCVCPIVGCEAKCGGLIDICCYQNKLTGRRWVDEFDYVTFLNQR